MARHVRQLLMIGLLAIVTGGVMVSSGLAAEPDGSRKITKRVVPVYSDIARKMQLIGTVKLYARVAPDGRVVSTEIIGGHPILAAAATEAAKRWTYEAAARESREMLVFAFAP
jgi:outer membrane biosynthesis protein TonB